MSKQEKAIKRILQLPRDYTFDEAYSLLVSLGAQPFNKGKTSGSRIEFRIGSSKLHLHKPHPGKELRSYQTLDIVNTLKKGEFDMTVLLEYKGFYGDLVFNADEGYYYGHLQGFPNLTAGYDGATLEAFAADFRTCVDDHIIWTLERGEILEKPQIEISNVIILPLNAFALTQAALI
jgi:hypothetical protein